MNTSQELEIIEIGPLFICPSTREVVLGPDATAAPLNLTRIELDVVTAPVALVHGRVPRVGPDVAAPGGAARRHRDRDA